MAVEKIAGVAWCYGNDINTDLIYPGRYLSSYDRDEMASHAMAGLDPVFSSKVKRGDIIVAGSNFGCGSSREQAAMCLKYAGVSAVIAESFARIFYRNIINQGVMALITPDAIQFAKSGDRIELHVREGRAINLTSSKECAFEPLPEFLAEIVEAGGYVQYLKKKLKK